MGFANSAINFLLLAAIFGSSQGSRILGVFLYPSQSHEVLAMALLEELAGKGHEVTLISTFKKDQLPKNFQHVHVDASDIRQKYGQHLLRLNVSLWEHVKFTNTEMKYMISEILEDGGLQEWLMSNETYDVAIMELFSEALLGISHRVNATTILFHPDGGNNGVDYLSGNPHPYSYVPNAFATNAGSASMGLWQRAINTYSNIFYAFTKHYFNMPIQKRLLNNHFPDAPSLETLIDAIDLHLLNSHPLVESARPYLPNMISIGGFHMQNPERLSPELQKYLDESKNGVVLCALGAHQKLGEFPVEIIETLFACFAQSAHNVIVQYEGSQLSNVPLNVRLMSWLPQRAILSHPNTKLFLTHGGRASYHEAIFFGVPMIGLTTSALDDANIAAMVNHGFGIRLDVQDLHAEMLSAAMKEVVANAAFKNAIILESQCHRNQAMRPLDKAVFWVEHVIKHKGAKRLKSPSASMPTYQYMLLDVLLVTVLLIVIVSLIAFCLVRYFMRVLIKCRSARHVKHKTV